MNVNWSGLADRMVRAAKLEKALFKEVEKDTKLTTEAMYAVILASVLAGVGSGLRAGIETGNLSGLVLTLITGALLAVIAYLVWAWVTYFVGTRLFKGKADYGQLRRTLGYAYAPTALNGLIFLPGVGGLIPTLATLWVLLAWIVAIREALNFGTAKAVLTVVVGWFVMLLLALVLGAILVGLGIGNI